jgi:hypothetical protein
MTTFTSSLGRVVFSKSVYYTVLVTCLLRYENVLFLRYYSVYIQAFYSHIAVVAAGKFFGIFVRPRDSTDTLDLLDLM